MSIHLSSTDPNRASAHNAHAETELEGASQPAWMRHIDHVADYVLAAFVGLGAIVLNVLLAIIAIIVRSGLRR